MKHLFFLLFFPYCLFAFTLASYNVHNLFDGTYQGSEYSDFLPSKWTKHNYKKKLQKTLRVLRDLDADILVLQEIENENVLLALKKRLNYPYHAVMNKNGGAVTLGTLSRFAITDASTLDVTAQQRGILHTVHRIRDQKLHIYNNHWRSLNAEESARRAYAQTLMEAVDADSEYILAGDFNSNYDRYLYLNQDAAINETLQTVHNEAQLQPRRLGPKQHYNLWLDIRVQQRFSYRYRGRNNTLDALILPQSMFDSKGIDYSSGSFGVFKPGYLYTKERINRAYSDHLPILADFAFAAYTPKDKTYKTGDITSLYTMPKLKDPLLLKKVHVIFKDSYGVTLKQKKGRAIYLYDPGIDLKPGGVYDLIAKRLGSYHGLTQLRKVEIKKYFGTAPYSHLLLKPERKDLRKARFGSEVIDQLKGRYKQGRLYYGGHSIDIYFRDKSKKPPEGSKITVKYAKIAKYKGSMQLVITKESKVE